MSFLPVILIASVLLGIGFLGMAIQIIFTNKKKVLNTHIGGNKSMMERGITCAQTWDKTEQKKAREELKFEELKLSNN